MNIIRAKTAGFCFGVGVPKRPICPARLMTR